MSDQAPSSTKPYLVRAIHEWCSDNGLTPYLAVAVTNQVRVPSEHVRNGEIVLNIGVLATDRLQITNEDITFQARFSGRVQQIFVPMENVVAIYAKETGNGMAFDVPKDLAALTEPNAPAASPSGLAAVVDLSTDTPPKPQGPSSGGKPRLTRVK
jgi:stringent starvation protein B